ncbi:ATP:cob(I)alamin adenosyltransferase [Ammoniphilus oxalaticus]|uniref:Corrinoid adenosyltransferase n=1 Tax=Ammoniphilus oxalaticus TaxID=66863 RepID=A0A419SD22_9BACL|nr:cob(I)yrinic acid a,c-diamide adenosyltransferase [Ammoniphilus oxalaticus]RKD21012.1 ATP:cob(I)alamin adenosyltransferase [Ammoniphilus oxalaticus]
MKIYTKSGDKGETSLVYGQRVPKDNERVEAYGACDEANSFIGVAMAEIPTEGRWGHFQKAFHVIQTKLFHVGAELSTPSGKKVTWPITAEDVLFLEQKIDQWELSLEPLSKFILPGGSKAGAMLHVARTVVRRAERRAISIGRMEEVNPIVIQYLNRLSDLLFIAARYVNCQLGKPEPTLHEASSD